MKDRDNEKHGIVRWYRKNGDFWEDTRLNGSNYGFYWSISAVKVFIVIYGKNGQCDPDFALHFDHNFKEIARRGREKDKYAYMVPQDFAKEEY